MNRTASPMIDSWQQAPIPPLRRGVCPTLSRPMKTGDGLLARLRPLEIALHPQQLVDIAAAASEFGNGILEVTFRGSLQIRGVRDETVAPLEAAIAAAGIVAAPGIAIETPPLAGFDPDEFVDPRPLASAIREAILAHEPPLDLAAKLSITVDGGGRFHLGDIGSDLKLTAYRESGGHIRFLLAIGGNSATARRVAILEESQVVEAVMAVLEALAALGPTVRGKDLDAGTLSRLFAWNSALDRISLPGQAPLPAGIHDFAWAGQVLGIGLPYCQAQAGDLAAFLEAVSNLGATEIRLAPGHGLLVIGLAGAALHSAQALAASRGFWISADEPRQHVALCAGARGCASAFFDTSALAERVMAKAPELLDGSFFLHLSGCPKGCAHPAAALITVTGAPTGYGLVVNGAASASPATYISTNDMDLALERLASLVRATKETDETVRACLTRLGANRIVSALQLG